jgi:hypothetical protein
MKKSSVKYCCLVFALIIASLSGCAGGSRGKLARITAPGESELRQTWQDYTVYYRRNLALIYKLTDDKTILRDERWVSVTSAEMMDKSTIRDTTWVKKILGQNDEMFGYLVHRYADRANVKIIDENTVELFYHYVQTSGGP